MNFNAAMFGGVASTAKAKQDLKASQAPAPEAREVVVHWHGSPYDGMRGVVGAQVPGQAVVVFANGKTASIPPAYLVTAKKKISAHGEQAMKWAKAWLEQADPEGVPDVEEVIEALDRAIEEEGPSDISAAIVKLKADFMAAPKVAEKVETEKSKKVVPADKPDTRGDAAQEEDLTKRAKEKSTEQQKPPVLEHMKKGPKAVPSESARTAPEAGGALATLIAAADAAQAATAAAAAEAAKASAKVGAAKSDEAKAVQLIVDEMEKTNTVVARIKDTLVALDASKNRAAVNIPKTGELRTRYDQAMQLLKTIQDQAKEQADVVKAIEAEAEEQYGGTYNVQKRVSLFPASLQAALAAVAGFSDMVKGLVDWVKGLFGMAEEAEAAVDAFGKELESSGAELVEASVQAELTPAMEGQIAAFVEANAAEAIEMLKRESLEEVSRGATWNSGDVAATLFDFLSEKWADALGMPGDDEDFEAFDKALDMIMAQAREQGVVFETMEFPTVEAAKATSEDAQKFVSDEIEHLIKDKAYEPARAKGAAYSIARRKGYKVGKKKSVEGGKSTDFSAFKLELRRRTGLIASDAGIADEAAFAASFKDGWEDKWITDFIKAHGLRDLAPRAARGNAPDGSLPGGFKDKKDSQNFTEQMKRRRQMKKDEEAQKKAGYHGGEKK